MNVRESIPSRHLVTDGDELCGDTGGIESALFEEQKACRPRNTIQNNERAGISVVSSQFGAVPTFGCETASFKSLEGIG